MKNKLNVQYKKLKIKYNKQSKKHTLEYIKISDKKAFRYGILKEINDAYDLFLFIDTGIDMYQKNWEKVSEGLEEKRIFTLTTTEGQENVDMFLRANKFEYSLRKKSRQVTKKIMGVSMGKTEMVKDCLLAVILDKGKLDEKVFNVLCESHDFVVGIDPTKCKADMLKSISEGEVDTFQEIQDFTYNLVDAQWMGYFYTDFDLSFFDA